MTFEFVTNGFFVVLMLLTRVQIANQQGFSFDQTFFSCRTTKTFQVTRPMSNPYELNYPTRVDFIVDVFGASAVPTLAVCNQVKVFSETGEISCDVRAYDLGTTFAVSIFAGFSVTMECTSDISLFPRENNGMPIVLCGATNVPTIFTEFSNTDPPTFHSQFNDLQQRASVRVQSSNPSTPIEIYYADLSQFVDSGVGSVTDALETGIDYVFRFLNPYEDATYSVTCTAFRVFVPCGSDIDAFSSQGFESIVGDPNIPDLDFVANVDDFTLLTISSCGSIALTTTAVNDFDSQATICPFKESCPNPVQCLVSAGRYDIYVQGEGQIAISLICTPTQCPSLVSSISNTSQAVSLLQDTEMCAPTQCPSRVSSISNTSQSVILLQDTVTCALDLFNQESEGMPIVLCGAQNQPTTFTVFSNTNPPLFFSHFHDIQQTATIQIQSSSSSTPIAIQLADLSGSVATGTGTAINDLDPGIEYVFELGEPYNTYSVSCTSVPVLLECGDDDGAIYSSQGFESGPFGDPSKPDLFFTLTVTQSTLLTISTCGSTPLTRTLVQKAFVLDFVCSFMTSCPDPVQCIVPPGTFTLTVEGEGQIAISVMCAPTVCPPLILLQDTVTCALDLFVQESEGMPIVLCGARNQPTTFTVFSNNFPPVFFSHFNDIQQAATVEVQSSSSSTPLAFQLADLSGSVATGTGTLTSVLNPGIDYVFELGEPYNTYSVSCTAFPTNLQCGDDDGAIFSSQGFESILGEPDIPDLHFTVTVVESTLLTIDTCGSTPLTRTTVQSIQSNEFVCPLEQSCPDPVQCLVSSGSYNLFVEGEGQIAIGLTCSETQCPPLDGWITHEVFDLQEVISCSTTSTTLLECQAECGASPRCTAFGITEGAATGELCCKLCNSESCGESDDPGTERCYYVKWPCSQNQFLCPESVCIDVSFVCDGIQTCKLSGPVDPLRNDEDDARCRECTLDGLFNVFPPSEHFTEFISACIYCSTITLNMRTVDYTATASDFVCTTFQETASIPSVMADYSFCFDEFICPEGWNVDFSGEQDFLVCLQQHRTNCTNKPLVLPPLETVIQNINSSLERLLLSIPDMFVWNSTTNGSRLDVPCDNVTLWFSGNILGTLSSASADFVSVLEYSDGVSSFRDVPGFPLYSVSEFPGLFVNIYDLNRVSQVTIMDSFNEALLPFSDKFSQRLTSFLRGFLSIYTTMFGTSCPSVNHIFIIEDVDVDDVNLNIQSTINREDNFLNDTVINMEPYLRLHYLLFMGANGTQYSMDVLQNIAETYLAVISPTGCDPLVEICGTNSVVGFVWFDNNENGIIDDLGPIGVANVTVDVFLDINGNGMVDSFEDIVALTVTDPYGNYATNRSLADGFYVAKLTDRFGALDKFNCVLFTTPVEVPLTLIDETATVNYGIFPPLGFMSGRIYMEEHRNDILDVDEIGFKDVSVDLFWDVNLDGLLDSNDLFVVRDFTTPAFGMYTFDNDPPGSYMINVSDVNNVLFDHMWSGGEFPPFNIVLQNSQIRTGLNVGYQRIDRGTCKDICDSFDLEYNCFCDSVCLRREDCCIDFETECPMNSQKSFRFSKWHFVHIIWICAEFVIL